MSRIDQQSREVKWKQIQQTNGPHPDYEKNLKHAETFCANVKKSLLRGMNVKISDGEHIPKALLIISWKPGFNEKIGNYATPICLHQYNEDFKQTTANVINFYMKSVGEHQAKNPFYQTYLNLPICSY